MICEDASEVLQSATGEVIRSSESHIHDPVGDSYSRLLKCAIVNSTQRENRVATLHYKERVVPPFTHAKLHTKNRHVGKTDRYSIRSSSSQKSHNKFSENKQKYLFS